MTSSSEDKSATTGYVDSAVEHLVETIHNSAEDIKATLRQELGSKIDGSEARILAAIDSLRHDFTEEISGIKDRVATLEYKA